MEDNGPIDRARLREILHFYADSGADEVMEDAAVDRFAQTAQAEAARARSAAQPATPETGRMAQRPAPRIGAPVPEGAERTGAAIPDEAQAARARDLARSASSLAELRRILEEFDGCNLKNTAKNMVFADGNPDARIMFVGEAPGRDEDIEGLPFVGRSGKLLDRMLAAIGLDRTSAYISNVIPWRPPGNRDPSPLEVEICRPFIERHIELMNPKVLVTLGNPSTKLLLQTKTGIMRMRGNWAVHTTPSGMEIPTMPSLHPAYLLRNPAHKKLAWHDFLAIMTKLRDAG